MARSPPTSWHPTDIVFFAIFVIVGLIATQCIVLDAVQAGDKQPPSNITQCELKTTCADCLQTAMCSWCSQPTFDNAKRCFLSSSPASLQCDSLVNPQNVQKTITNESLTGKYDEKKSTDKVVQIQPQQVNLTLRINQSIVLDVQYSRSEGYPIDLYCLMDLSMSMAPHRDMMMHLSDDLIKMMLKLTTDFQLGFGGFIEKDALPFGTKLLNNKTIEPFAFKNLMALSKDTHTFQHKVKNTKILGNLDQHESGFDGLMQAIVCQKVIRWREGARHLLLYISNEDYHTSGDGQLGGIILPNDGQCHLDYDGLYDPFEKLDYPSVSQINHVAKSQSVNIIFAVTNNTGEVYKELSTGVTGSSFAVLNNDSSNVVQLVQEEYDKISSTIEMKDNNTLANVHIKYYSACGGTGEAIETNMCGNLSVGKVVTFNVEFTVTSCPENRNDWKQAIWIKPIGLEEELIVNVEMLCECPCERQWDPAHTEECRHNGADRCGLCQCDQSHWGQKCECEKNGKNKQDGCRSTPTAPACSGRGDCLCDRCECRRPDTGDAQHTVQGAFCEKDNFHCARADGLLCSGPLHGSCELDGKCHCNDNWTGAACDCLVAPAACVAPNAEGQLSCSGHGRCECGECKCDTTVAGHRYVGKFCEACPTCPRRCEELRPCVDCLSDPQKKAEECPANCTSLADLELVEKPNGHRLDEYLCEVTDGRDCKYTFSYVDPTGGADGDGTDGLGPLKVHMQRERDCPPIPSEALVGLAVVASVLVIGLVSLLVWKMLTLMHDQREYAKFLNDSSKETWEETDNPIFKSTVTTIMNPMYKEE